MRIRRSVSLRACLCITRRAAQIHVHSLGLYFGCNVVMRRCRGSLQAALQRYSRSSESGLQCVLGVQSVLTPLSCRLLLGSGSLTACQWNVDSRPVRSDTCHTAAARGQSTYVALQRQTEGCSHIPAATCGLRASSGFDEKYIGKHHRQAIDQQRILQSDTPQSLAKSAVTATCAWIAQGPATGGPFSFAHRMQRNQFRQFCATSSSQQNQQQDAHLIPATQQHDDGVPHHKPDKEVLYRGKVHTTKMPVINLRGTSAKGFRLLSNCFDCDINIGT